MNNYIELEQTEAPFKMIAIEGNIDSEPFDMGGESWDKDSLPVHKVRLSDYWMGELPVTQAVWAYVMQGTDMADPSNFKGHNRPVEQVSWNDIKDIFLGKLNKMTEGMRPNGTQYRLPIEAEWEYAAKGGKYWKALPFEYAGGDKLNEVGWYNENSHAETKPVGLKMPNLLGLYDMSGNVYEWCEDWYSGDFYKECEQQGVVIDPCNRKEGRNRVDRGGSWIYGARHCRPANRYDDAPSHRYNFLGFRLVLSFPSV